MTDTRRARASRQNLPRLQGIMRHPPECCDPARYLFRLKGLMINNGDAIGRLKALLHLRGAHEGSSHRERVAGDLLRLRGIMTDIRRARVSRQNLPRLQGARELMPAVCPACSRPRLREPSCGCLPRCGKVLKASPLGKLSSG